jgi:glycosyltransferase involved in cell wall biosynthesis
VTPSGAQDRPLDVLALIDHFVLGGAETLLARFAAAADQAQIDLQVACLADLNGNPAAAPLVAAGRPPVNLELPGRPSLHALRVVRRHMDACQPALVHTHLGDADLLGGLAARSLGIPVVATIHAMRWQTRDAWRRRLVSLCADRIIAVSDSARAEYLRLGWAREEQVVTIPNGSDLVTAAGEGAAVRRELGLAPDDLVVAMVSALRPEKGHDVALAAVGALRERFPNLRLLIVGAGDLEGELSAAAQASAGTVVMAGLRSDVMRVLDAADVLLHPSRADAYPTTLLEAMAASVPVLASAVGGIPEIVTAGETGVLVSAPPQAAEVARALAALLADGEQRARLARAGRAQYEREFTALPWVTRTRALYDVVLHERASRARSARPLRAVRGAR